MQGDPEQVCEAAQSETDYISREGVLEPFPASALVELVTLISAASYLSQPCFQLQPRYRTISRKDKLLSRFYQ
jgi:hypothetical protein